MSDDIVVNMNFNLGKGQTVADIVTLLRKYQPYNVLHGQAADEIERLRADRDRWRNVADELVKAADIQVHLSSVPHRYPWYSQHLKDALAQYKEAQK